MNPTYFFLGCVTVKADYDNITALLNLCMYYCIPYTDFTPEADGVRLTFRLSAVRKLQKEADARGVKYDIVEKYGLPIFLGRYKYRFGIFLGVILAAALVFMSEQFVWDIDVVGNESITTGEIRALLEAEGFSVGTYIPDANTDKIENRILMNTNKISWMSINIIGTVAQVQIRELEAPGSEVSEIKYANLVAKKSGLVEEVRILRGNVVVSAGKYVEKGDLLVSGLYDSLQEGIRFTDASGEVYARTTTEFYIEIPYDYEEKVYNGVEYYDKYLNFFDYSINISKNSRKEEALYDKITIVENFCFPDGKETPFGLFTVKYMEYETVTKRRTAQEAENLAYFELSARLAEAAVESTMLKKTVIPVVREDCFVLMCSVVMIEDIAAVSEFEVVP